MNLSFPRKEQDDLQQKLRQLERKLIVGGENLLDKAAKQAQLLEESEQELEKRALNEEQLRKELQQKEVFSYSMIMYLLCFSLGWNTWCTSKICIIKRRSRRFNSKIKNFRKKIYRSKTRSKENVFLGGGNFLIGLVKWSRTWESSTTYGINRSQFSSISWITKTRIYYWKLYSRRISRKISFYFSILIRSFL